MDPEIAKARKKRQRRGGLLPALAISLAAHLPVGIWGQGLVNKFLASPMRVEAVQKSDVSIPEFVAIVESESTQYSAATIDAAMADVDFPESDAAAEGFLFPRVPKPKQKQPLPEPELPEDAALYTPQKKKRKQAQESEEEDDIIDSPLVLTKPLPERPHPKEPMDLEGLLQARRAFHAQLLQDMQDPPGRIRLDSMHYDEFFVRRAWYKYAIEHLEDGEPLEFSIEDMYRTSDAIIGTAENIIRGHTGGEISSVNIHNICHSILMSKMRGYERGSASMVHPLIKNILNCNSGTKTELLCSTEFDPHAMVNVYQDHVQAATPHNGRVVTVENTTPVAHLTYHKRGTLFPPEVYVVGYLLKNGFSMGDFPLEIQEWYGYPWPNFLEVSGAGEGLPLVEDHSGIKKPEAGFRPIRRGRSRGGEISIREVGITDLTSSESGMGEATRDTEGDIAERYPTPEEILKRRVKGVPTMLKMIKQDVLRKHAKDTTTWVFDVVENTIESAQKAEDFRSARTLYEQLGVYDDRPPQVFQGNGSLRATDVLAPDIRDGNLGRVGLLVNLEPPKPGVAYVGKLPKVDWCALAQNVLDNKVLLHGNRLEERTRGIYQRAAAFQRAQAFGGVDCTTSSIDERMSALEAIVQGKPVRDFKRLFSSHEGYNGDPLVPMRVMATSTGTQGMSLLAVEDMLSFRGEKYTINAIATYLERDDLALDRIGYGRLLMGVHNRLLLGRDEFHNELAGLSNTNPELQVAIAQFSHVTGGKSHKISKALANYLRSRTNWRTEEVVNLVETGLDPAEAVRIMREQFQNRFTALKSPGELWERYTASNGWKASSPRTPKDPTLDPSMQAIVDAENSLLGSLDSLVAKGLATEKAQAVDHIRQMVEDYETLAALGDDFGFTVVSDELHSRLEPYGIAYKEALLPFQDLAKMLVEHGKFTPTHISRYRERLTILDPMYGHQWEPSLIRVMMEGGLGDQVELLAKEVVAVTVGGDKDGTHDYYHTVRLSAAATLYALGERDLARRTLVEMVGEGCFGVGGDSTPMGSLMPLHFLARYRVSPDDQKRLVDMFQNDNVCFEDGFHMPDLEKAIDKDAYRQIFQNKPLDVNMLGVLTDAYVVPLLLPMFHEEQMERLGPHISSLESLGLDAELPTKAARNVRHWGEYGVGGKLASSRNAIAGLHNPIIRASLGKAKRILDGSAIPGGAPSAYLDQMEEFYRHFPTYTPADVHILLRCYDPWGTEEWGNGNTIKASQGEDCLFLLISRGYIGIDKNDNVAMFNPPRTLIQQ